MNYNIYINQKAIVALNVNLKKKLDLKDVTILDWMLKFHAEPKSKKLMMGEDHVYFWGAYALIIRENPLLNISDKQKLAVRIDKLIDAGLLHKFLSKEKGNKTYFCIAQKCFDLLNRDQLPLHPQKHEATPPKDRTLHPQKHDNNNISYNITTTTVIEKLENNEMLVETMQIRYGKSVDIKAKIGEFAMFCIAIEKQHNNNMDLFTHFTYWLASNASRPAVQNVDKQITWFIDQFNKKCNGQYKVTDEITKLFTVQLNNGFTGMQMAEAINNMFSSDAKNWHKEKGYAHATPVHLLKADNMNKYLNQKF